MLFKRFFMLGLVLTLLCAFAYAQYSTGQISGFVRDESGAFVPGVTVKITNPATGSTREVITQDNGYYVVPNLPVGTYEITVELQGFKRFIQRDVKVDPTAKVTVDITLQVGEIAEVVEVQASAAVVSTETSQVGRLVEAHQMTEIALNGRNFVNLLMLKAGVNATSFFNTFTLSMHQIGSFRVNGSRGEDNVVTVDGVMSTRTRANHAVIGLHSIDTMQEAQILTSNYNAEYGRTAGGQISYVTKSGTKEFHGSLYEFLRNDVFDARSFFAPRKEKLRFNDFGWTFGGPIYIPGKWNTDRSKFFFFAGQEWGRFLAGSTTVQVVPTLKMRTGDFSELLDPNNRFTRRATTIIDPNTRQPFPGNIIPANRLSRNGLAFMNMYPLPNTNLAAGNYTDVQVGKDFQRSDVMKFDYIAGRTRISTRLSHYDLDHVDPRRGGFRLAPAKLLRPNRSMGVNIATTISPHHLNEFQFGAAADIVHILVTGPYQRSLYRIDYPYLFPGTKDLEDKIPTVLVSGFGDIDGGPYPGFSAGPIFHWADNFTMIRGSHTIKFGIYIERSGENDLDQINVSAALAGLGNNQNGTFRFGASATNPNSTGYGLADMLLGNFDTYSEIGRKSYTPWRATGFETFVQDSWKVRPNFTLEYGLRYNLWPPFHSLWNNIAMFHPDFYDPAKAVAIDPRTGAVIPGSGFIYNGIVLPGDGFPEKARGRVGAFDDPLVKQLFHGLPLGFSRTSKNLFDPRLGFSWDPTKTGKMAIRGGFGIYHNRQFLNDSTLLGGNPPLQPAQQVANGQVDNPAGGARALFPIPISMQDLIFKIPTAYNWSITVQRELPGNIVAEIGYVGKRGKYLLREVDINQLPEGTVQRNPGVNPEALRRFRGLSAIRLAENAASSAYDSLQISLDRRFSAGLSFGIA